MPNNSNTDNHNLISSISNLSFHEIDCNDNSTIQLQQLSSSSKLTKILHWNCNSITNKLDEFKSFLSQNKPDIVSLNEIKCDSYDKLNIHDYNVIFKCRSNKGGSVALLINDRIKFVESNIDKEFEEEVVGFTCKINNTTISFFSYYNPPSREINVNIFNFIQNNAINYLIMGDLNAKSILFSSNEVTKMEDY